jgi:Na+/H+-dicarboxylate symporter
MLVAIVVAVAAWALFGGLAGAAVVALLALYATLLVVYLGAMAVLAGLGPALDKRRTDFQDALKDILAHCSPECRGDLSQPDCRLQ